MWPMGRNGKRTTLNVIIFKRSDESKQHKKPKSVCVCVVAYVPNEIAGRNDVACASSAHYDNLYANSLAYE